MSQLPKVDSRRGAPMGRDPSGTPEQTAPRSLRVFKVRLDSGGYDDGGAYWGLRLNGEAIYCATDSGDYWAFTDARTRTEAVDRLGIPADRLLQPPRTVAA